MSKEVVKTVNTANEALARLAELMKSVYDEVRDRAYALFLERGCGDGHDMEDWLAAEHELLVAPPCELTENAHQLRIKAEVAGFDAQALQVNVLPDSITIEGCMEKQEEKNGETTISRKRLLRQLSLPVRIDPETVKASLDKNILEVVMKKETVNVTPTIHEVKRTRTAAA
ncbi:MAG TPA: DUF2934 domain-containing protein [Bryobacteraceae bacterium]|nr:DUF2934 domain-containing protein [Bryobacteraceae bacterium]